MILAQKLDNEWALAISFLADVHSDPKLHLRQKVTGWLKKLLA